MARITGVRSTNTIVVVDSFKWIEVVPWLLVILGWMVAIAQSGRHDDRVDARASIDRIEELLADLESKAIRYHVSGSPSAVDALEIKALLARISSQVIQLDLLDRSDLRNIGYLRQSITLNNFDTAKHMKQEQGSELLQEIGIAVNDVGSSLEENYSKKFGRKFLGFI